MDSDLTLYQIIGCDITSTSDQIIAEYRARVLNTHPDKVNAEIKEIAEKKFNDLQFAKEILCDKERRKHYDLYLKMGRPLGITLHKWMNNFEQVQQSMHWAQSENKTPMLPNNITSNESQLESDSCYTQVKYPRKFEGWISHNSPTIQAFRNYQI